MEFFKNTTVDSKLVPFVSNTNKKSSFSSTGWNPRCFVQFNSVVQCSTTTPGKPKEVADIFGYIHTSIFTELVVELIIKIFFCGTVRNMHKLNTCLARSVESIYLY